MSAAPPRVVPPTLPEAPKQSVFARLIIGPLTFLTYLLSFALIDNHNASVRQRNNSQTSRPSGLQTLLGRIRDAVGSVMFERGAYPYSYVRSLDVVEREKSMAGEVAGRGRRDGKQEPWHWSAKQRKMLKTELEDAFELRKRVVVVLLAVGAGLGVLGLWVVNWGVKIWRA